MGIESYRFSYETSPIFLTGGAYANTTAGGVSLLSITQSMDFSGLTGQSDTDPNNFFFRFAPMPGGTLIDQDAATYPFANAGVAANATITNPLIISCRMLAPVPLNNGGWAAKKAVFGSMQAALAQHNAAGGTYTYATPSFVYTDLIMKQLRDISPDDAQKPQLIWEWDFFKPLVSSASLAQALQRYNNLMQQAANGVKVTPGPDGSISWSGPDATVGNASSLAAASLFPSAGGQAASLTGTPSTTQALGG